MGASTLTSSTSGLLETYEMQSNGNLCHFGMLPNWKALGSVKSRDKFNLVTTSMSDKYEIMVNSLDS